MLKICLKWLYELVGCKSQAFMSSIITGVMDVSQYN